MGTWKTIKTCDDLPEEDERVLVQLENEEEMPARLTVNKSYELVWEFQDGGVAHLVEFSEREVREFGLVTVPTRRAPVAWMREVECL